MESALHGERIIEGLLHPETDLEKTLINHPEFIQGLLWGKPRYGHPEGKVVFHVAEVLSNIERLRINGSTRRQLRLIAYVHDTFKHIEDQNRPRDWSLHHSILARKFSEQFISDPSVLSVIEHHDEAFYSWRMEHQFNQVPQGISRMQKLLGNVDNHLQLYYLFFKCDTRTGDKNQAPLKWFESTVKNIDIVNF